MKARIGRHRAATVKVTFNAVSVVTWSVKAANVCVGVTDVAETY